MSSKNPDIIAAGHICLDLIPRFLNKPGVKMSDLIRPGTLLRMGDITFSTGGPVSNTGIALKIFGCNVGFVAKVGDDFLGTIIMDMLRKQGNADGIRIARNEQSSYTVVIVPQGIDRVFLHCPGTNDTFNSGDLDFKVISKAKLFHLGYPTLMHELYSKDGRELVRIFRQVKQAGLTTSIDMSLPDPSSPAGRADWPLILKRLLPSVDLYVPSIEESLLMLNPGEWVRRRKAAGGNDLLDDITPDEYTKIADTFLGMGSAIVGLKCGKNGWYLKTGTAARLAKMGRMKPGKIEAWANKELWAPAYYIKKIASATGSGDSSIAGFLAAFSRGLSPEMCLRMANGAGNMNLTAMDALSGLRPWSVMEKISRKPKFEPNTVINKARGWKWNVAKMVWEKPA